MNNWKPNWTDARCHFTDWWKRKGFVLGMWGHGYLAESPLHADVAAPPCPPDMESRHTDPDYLSRHWHHVMAHSRFPADTLPVVCPGVGTVELAPYLGAEPSFQENTIWYDRRFDALLSDSPLVFDPENKWYRLMLQTLQSSVSMAEGNYMVGLPGISPNLDVLAELRGTAEVLMDLVDRPEWVRRKLEEIDGIYFDVYDRMYDVVKLSDGSSSFYYFMLWAPGKVTQLQCDTAAMISADMFRECVVPGLRKVCSRIDYTLFHVDGPDMLKHVDALLAIEELDAIQFTPGPGVPGGGDPHWHDLYRRILDAGKCVQAVWMQPDEVLPLLDATGGNGLYMMVDCSDADEMEQLAESVRG